MRDQRRRLVLLAWLVLGLAYVGAYGGLRAGNGLVRTGVFHNVRLPGGELGPDGGWMQSGVQRPANSRDGQWLEVMFWPLARTESLFWDTAGRRLRQI